MVGTPNSFAVLASATVLFFSCWRPMLTTPKDICGWWSMKRKTVSSALISDLARKVMVVSEAADILNRRVVASLDEIKAAARSKAAVVDEVKAAAQDVVVKVAAYPKTGGRVAVIA